MNFSRRSEKSSFDPIKAVFRQQAAGDSISNGIEGEKVPPFLRALLVTDGTVTQFLQAYLWEPQDILRGKLGIGELLRDRRLETYREMLNYGSEAAGALSDRLGTRKEDPLLFRHYRILTKHRPAILVTEKFPAVHFL